MERKVKYDLAFKLICVEAILKKTRTINFISSREGFDEKLLRKWISDYQSKGTKGLIPKHKNNWLRRLTSQSQRPSQDYEYI